MASSYFKYSPTSGTGSTEISVCAKTTNYGQTDRNATITFTTGTYDAQVGLKQLHKPYFTQFANNTFPASGGSIYFEIHTDYDVVFRSIPLWITVSYNGVNYGNGDRVPAATANNHTFTITAEPNTGAARSIGSSMNMAHYVDNVLQPSVQYFSFSQSAGTSSAVINTTPSILYLDYKQGMSGRSTITTTGVTNVTISNGDTIKMTVNPSTGANNTVITATTRTINTTHHDYSLPITVSDSAGVAASKTITVVQRYLPYIVRNGGTSGIPSTGGSFTFQAFTEYDIVFNNVPSWCTISANGTNYPGGQRIASGTANETVFTVTVDANDGYDRTQTISVEHYIGNTLQAYESSISVSQSGSAASIISVVPSELRLDYPANSQGSFYLSMSAVTGVSLSNSNPQNFTLSQPSATSPTRVYVTANYLNNYHNSITGTITATDNQGSAETKTVSVIQLYRPYFQQFASTNFPSTGGNIYFEVHTEYDIVFRSVPDWITISLDNVTYGEGTRISSGVANNHTFTLTAAPNTGSARSVGTTFNMGHYIGDTLQDFKQYFSFTQDEMQTAIAVSPSELVLDYTYNNTKEFSVQLFGVTGATVTNNDTTNFYINPSRITSNTAVTVGTNYVNTTHSAVTTTLDVEDDDSVAAVESVQVTQLYRPYFQQFASSNIPGTGGSVYFTVHSDYDIVFRSIPDWVTVTLDNVSYPEGQRIASSVANGRTFAITAPANTGASRGVGSSMSMGHYIGDTLQNYSQYFSFTQSSGSPATSATITFTADGSWLPAGASVPGKVSVTSYDNYSTSYSFTLTPENPTALGYLDVKLNPTGTTSLSCLMSIFALEGMPNGTVCEFWYGETGNIRTLGRYNGFTITPNFVDGTTLTARFS